MYPCTWHLEKADGIHDWLHVCRSLRHCISWIGKRGGIDGVRRFGAHVPKSLVRRSLAFGNAQVARLSQNLKLTRRSWQCSAGGVTTRTVDSRWKKYEKVYRTKVNPLAEAKWQNKYKKRKKTNSSATTSTLCAKHRRDTRLAGRNRNQRAPRARRHDIRNSL
jgi:hypothetical protein